MPGNKQGGAKAAATNKQKYGEDFYRRIGSAGGKKGRTGGFFANRELARLAGAKGGSISRRGKVKLTELERLRIEERFGKVEVPMRTSTNGRTIVQITN